MGSHPGRTVRAHIRLLALVLVVLTAACQVQVGPPFGPPSSRILFIGNSYTFYNGGVDQALKRLAPSIEVRQVAVGGYRLEDHWSGGDALPVLHSQKWDYVVLQEQSQTPVTGQASFLMYASKFDAEIRASGGKTVLFMTWERPDSIQYGVTTNGLAQAYNLAGARLGALVAPVGLAFARARMEQPGLSLNLEDGHPTPQGTYLASCVLYATLFQKSPVGVTYMPSGMTEQQRDFLQRVAAAETGY